MRSESMRYLKPLGTLGRNQRGAVEAGAIITGLIALILVYSLAPTIVTQSENAALEVEAGSSNTTGAPIFRLGPLFWALVGIGVAASIVIGAMRVKG